MSAPLKFEIIMIKTNQYSDEPLIATASHPQFPLSLEKCTEVQIQLKFETIVCIEQIRLTTSGVFLIEIPTLSPLAQAVKYEDLGILKHTLFSTNKSTQPPRTILLQKIPVCELMIKIFSFPHYSWENCARESLLVIKNCIILGRNQT